MFVLGPLLHNVAAVSAAAAVTTATLNPSDVSGLTLSNGNLTATGTASSPGGVRASRGMTTGKFYWEVTVGSNTNGDLMTGLADASATLTSWWYTGGGVHAAVQFETGGGLGWNGGWTSTGLTTPTAADVVLWAYDADNSLLWVGKNGTWMTGGNPSAGTGGRNITGISTPVYPGMQGDGSTADAATYNFGATAYAYTPPTGFGNV